MKALGTRVFTEIKVTFPYGQFDYQGFHRWAVGI